MSVILFLLCLKDKEKSYFYQTQKEVTLLNI